jgi:hypothetical protein
MRGPGLVVFVGLSLCAGALVLAAITGAPYLSADGVNGWIVVFAAGLFAAFGALPFALERRLQPSHPDRDERWDRVVPVWGAVALAVLAAGLLAGVGAGFAGDSLAGSAGLLAAIESGIVVVALVFVLLSG